MKIKSSIILSEIFIFVLLLLIFVSLLYVPSNILMPMRLDMVAIVLLIASFFVFATLYWREKPTDERESFHRLEAGRTAFLAGSTVMVLALTVQTFEHDVDPWLIISLLVMVTFKLFSRIWSRLSN